MNIVDDTRGCARCSRHVNAIDRGATKAGHGVNTEENDESTPWSLPVNKPVNGQDGLTSIHR